MVRTPCCEKMGLKKGPWTPEEDRILISYIQRFGHGNWRALPKQAGLLRCGKSCRLRWTNYLRPDIKRGNFSMEEEETIIKLHQILGNRWSSIAAKLPGRTDNEIKNFWHSHLKKKVQRSSSINTNTTTSTGLLSKYPIINPMINTSTTTSHRITQPVISHAEASSFTKVDHDDKDVTNASSDHIIMSFTRNINVISVDGDHNNNYEFLPKQYLIPSAAPKTKHPIASSSSLFDYNKPKFQISVSSDHEMNQDQHNGSSTKNSDEDMEFWYNLFVKAGDQTGGVTTRSNIGDFGCGSLSSCSINY